VAALDRATATTILSVMLPRAAIVPVE